MNAKKLTALKTTRTGKRNEWDDPAAVDRLIQALNHPLKPEMEAIRSIILDSDSRITEGIKWNAPSFYCNGWFATYHVRSRDRLQVIFHRGAKVRANPAGRLPIDDPTGLLKWLAKDRCIATFSSASDLAAKKSALNSIVSQWANMMARTAAP